KRHEDRLCSEYPSAWVGSMSPTGGAAAVPSSEGHEPQNATGVVVKGFPLEPVNASSREGVVVTDSNLSLIAADSGIIVRRITPGHYPLKSQPRYGTARSGLVIPLYSPCLAIARCTNAVYFLPG